jgi:polyisoprenoid-binding protein YceI
MKTTSWNIDTSHSSVSFAVRHMVFAKVKGRFAQWSGRIQLDEDDITRSAVEVEIQASSIDTGVADRDNHLRSADFFDVEQYPTLSFVSKRVERGSGDSLHVTGDLTIAGVTREVRLQTDFGGRGKDPWGKERVAFSAETKINRKDFGLTWNQALETGGVLVGEDVEISLDVQAVSAAASKAA